MTTCKLGSVNFNGRTKTVTIHYYDAGGKEILIEVKESNLPAPFCMLSPLAIISFVNNNPKLYTECLFTSPTSWYEEA